MKYSFPALALALLLLSGCAGYELGTVRPTSMRGIETVSVENFRNETLRPRVEVMAANSLIKQLQLDGTYRIVPGDQADALITGRVVEIRRSQARAARGNVFQTREFRLFVTLEVEVMDRITGEILMQRTVRGDSSFFFSDDLLSEERQALPLAMEKAAVQLASLLTEGF